MSKKIIIVQYGSDEGTFPLLSLAIGFQKAYPGSQIIWAGEPHLLELVRYNKRIKHIIDVTRDFTMDTLSTVFGSDICVNVSSSTLARQFASNTGASKIYGFDRNGPTSRSSEFFRNVLDDKISTKKTLLQLHYDLAEMNWKGEGYGLSYYPKTKQTKKCGLFAYNEDFHKDDCVKTKIPPRTLHCLDTLNKFSNIITDDLFVSHASIALRKHCTLVADLPYKMEFFGKGTVESFVK